MSEQGRPAHVRATIPELGKMYLDSAIRFVKDMEEGKDTYTVNPYDTASLTVIGRDSSMPFLELFEAKDDPNCKNSKTVEAFLDSELICKFVDDSTVRRAGRLFHLPNGIVFDAARASEISDVVLGTPEVFGEEGLPKAFYYINITTPRAQLIFVREILKERIDLALDEMSLCSASLHDMWGEAVGLHTFYSLLAESKAEPEARLVKVAGETVDLANVVYVSNMTPQGYEVATTEGTLHVTPVDGTLGSLQDLADAREEFLETWVKFQTMCAAGLAFMALQSKLH